MKEIVISLMEMAFGGELWDINNLLKGNKL